MKISDIRIASSLVKMARELLVTDDEASENGSQSDDAIKNDLEREKKHIEDNLDMLYNEFQDALGERVKVYEAAQAQFKKIETEMSQAFSAFKKATGWEAQMKSCAREIEAFEKAGGLVSEIRTSFQLATGKSMQPSYKEWLRWVVAAFDNDEVKAYVSKLEVFKKNTVSLSGICKQADVKLNEWSDEANELFDEEGLKLPTASKEAGAVSDFMKGAWEKLKSWAYKLFDEIGKSISKLADSCNGNAKEMEMMAAAMERMNKRLDTAIIRHV